jgi:hypothetical protein
MSRAQLKAECYRRIAGAAVSDRQRFLLLHYVATYLKLKQAEQREFRQIMEQTEYAEARETERTWSEELMDEGERRGELRGELRAVEDLCEVLGIELTPARMALVKQMSREHLTALRTYLKIRRAWPS